MKDTMTLLIDGVAGIYVPKKFYDTFDFASWKLNKGDFEELWNVDSLNYWDVWDELLSVARHVDDDGQVWTLHQSEGDLFAVSEAHDWEETE